MNPLPKRRNGQSAACEPCRKAKIRCNRSLPACSRCTKRRIPAQCIFLDQPSKLASASIGAIQVAPVISDFPAAREEERTPETHSEIDESPGYLGQTAFSATLGENGLSMHTELTRGTPSIAQSQPASPDPRTQELGIKILSHFPSQKVSTAFLDWYLVSYATIAFHKPTLRACLVNFWSAFSVHFKSRKPSDIALLAAKITQNGRTPIPSHDDADIWISGFTGENTRWETVGILYIKFCYTCLSMSRGEFEWLLGGEGGPERRSAMLRGFKECVEACIELSKHSLNCLVYNMLTTHVTLESVLLGDTALSVWRTHSYLVSTAIAAGLHCYQGPAKVTLESEITKRTSASIFWTDKELCMFTGRPPGLSHRYYSAALPLDVSDEALAAGGATLEIALSKISPEGWNTDGEFHDSTTCRIRCMHAVGLDQIMEIFLGTEAQWDITRVYEIKSRVHALYATAPLHLTVSKAALMEAQDDITLWRLLLGRLDWLRMNFLIERLLTERGGVGKKDLLQVALEMLELIVFLWVERDRSQARQHDYDFLIMCFGMPSIGVLCTALLAQVKLPHNAQSPEIKLPISELVQNLSMMIGFLNWVKPTAGNYRLCRRMSGVIKRILDQVFETQGGAVHEDPGKGESSGNGNELVRDGEGEMPGLLTPEFETADWTGEGLMVDDLEWLNSIDWTQGPYGEPLYGS